MGFVGLSSSLSATSTTLTSWVVSDRYNNNGSLILGVTKMGGDDRYIFKSWRAASTSGVQSMGTDFLSSLKKGRARSPSLEMNRSPQGGNASVKALDILHPLGRAHQF